MNEQRFKRNIMVPEIGANGQQKLADASVLVIGAGGLGSPVIQYLAAAGVGCFTLIDPDVLDESNLQRQVLYRQQDIGKPKVLLAADRVKELDPQINVTTYQQKYTTDNCQDLSLGCQVIVDCTDNYQSREVINEYAVRSSTPFVHGAVENWSGQLFTWIPSAACYRCLFKELPVGLPLPADQGIVGAVAGIIGSLQALEVIKLLIGSKELLTNSLLTYNALSMRFHKTSFTKDSQCTVCS